MSTFKLHPISNIMKQSHKTSWLIKNYFEHNTVAMIYGQPATFKSFLAIELAFCVSCGIDWYGNKTSSGNVVYLAGEGHSGIKKRFAALQIKYQLSGLNLFISEKPASLISKDSVEEVYKTISDSDLSPALIIIDTLHRNFGDGDENSSKDFGLLMHNVDALRAATGATILMVHHSGHGNSSRSRGSSAIRASLDTEYQLSRKGQELACSLTCEKMKDSEPPSTLNFKFNPIEIPTLKDDSGKPVKSGYFDHSIHKVDLQHSKPNQTELAFDLLKQLSTGNKAINVSDWKDSFTAEINHGQDENSLSKAFSRVRSKLKKENKIEENNDLITIL